MQTALMPYEGTKEYIFVSYSHKDREKVLGILEVLSKQGFRIWYDEGIEWGSEWPASIAKHLHDCAVVMAFHSKTSAVSTNCRQEINYAIKYQKSIISVYLEEVDLEPGVDMQLTLFQSTYAYQYEDQDLFYSRLIETPLLQCCRDKEVIMLPIGGTTSNKTNQCSLTGGTVVTKKEDLHEINIDHELSDKFEDIFGVLKEDSDKNQTVLEKKVSEIKTKKFVNALEMEILKRNPDLRKDIYTINSKISLIPIDYENDNTGAIDGMRYIKGKHFVIPNLPGFKRILFEVYRGVDYKTYTKYYYPEPLDSAEQLSEENGSGTMYFIDDPIPEGNQIIILDFNPLSNEAYINMGLLLGDEVRISKKPVLFVMKRLYVDDDGDSAHLISSAYDLNGVPDTSQDETTEKWFEADLLQNPVIIIDPETAQPVRREVYFDENSGERKARIKLTPYKSYFSFQIRSSESNNTYAPLSELEIASYYRDGEYGFPQDVFEALAHYEKDGSANAFYEIATLFRTDKTLLDKDTYLEYIEKAADMGSERASIELALQCSQKDSTSDKDQAERLLNGAIGQNSAVSTFVLGYLIESGALPGGAEKAFDYYVKAAKKSYEPALARLCCAQKGLEHQEELFNFYIENLEYGLTIARYCMGCIHFFGLGIYPDKPKGIEFLVGAANMGNEMAADALFTIYDIDPECCDDSKALFWLKEVERFDLSVTTKLANRLLDGTGCAVCGENDRLAFELLQKAAEAGDKIAIHNLGWLYREGRGCYADYEMARKLFESAERPNSFYYLGEMYESGLGVPADMEKAIDCYKKAAELGSKKAINRLEELSQDNAVQ